MKTICRLTALIVCVVPNLLRAESRGLYLVYASHGAFHGQAADTTQADFSDTDAAKLLNSLVSLPDCHAIRLAGGDYPMTASLLLKNDLSLSGRSSARLVQQGACDLIHGTAVTNCQITCLELAGKDFAGRGVVLMHGSRSNLLAKLYIHDLDGDGILLGDSNTQYNVVTDNHIENCTGGAGIGLGATAGDAIIERNFIRRTRFHGIIVSYGGSRCLIADNTVIDAGYYMQSSRGDFAHGIAVDGWGKVHGTDNVIARNIIRHAGMAGIEVADFQDNCTIVGNDVDGTSRGSYGIYFGGGLAPSTNVIIANNVVRNAEGSGIHIDSPLSGEKGVTSGALISGNTVSDSGDNGIRIGVAAGVTIVNNICGDNGRNGPSGNGIWVHGRGEPSGDIILSGNRCFDDGKPPRQRYGLWLEDASNVWAFGNALDLNESGPVYRGPGLSKIVLTP